MAYVIHGATGAQGAPLFKKLLAEGKNVLAAVRNPEAVAGPAVAVDMFSADSLATAYAGADGIFVHLPLGPEEFRLQYARNIAKAIDLAKPRRVVLSTSGWSMDVPGDENALPTLVREVRNTGVSLAVIAPRLYLENLLLPIVMEPVKAENVLRYPLRSDYAVSWCSHLDIADVAVALWPGPAASGTAGDGHLPAITGDELAAAFSSYWGRKVAYESLQPVEFGRMLAPLFGEEAAAGAAASYEAKAQTRDSAIDTETSAQQLLGISPRTVEQWLFEIGI